MRPGITLKLFAAILGSSIVVVLVMALAGRFSFTRGFLEYVNRAEVARLESLSAALAAGYEDHGDWNFLRDGNRQWWRLIMASARPPHEGSPATGSHPGPPPPHLVPLGPRLSLFDANHGFVAGNPRPAPEAVLQPITASGRTVGWLAVMPFRRLTSDIDLRFENEQRRTALLIAAISILLAAAVAILLSRHLLRPVQRLAEGTRALAAGDFAARITPSSRDELGRLANDFNLLAHTLEQNQQARRSFLADVAHELRTPLAVLRGELEAIEDGVRQLTPAALESLQYEVRTLVKLVEDLHELALSDIGALDYRKSTIDIVAFLEVSVEGFRERLSEQRLSLELDLPSDARLCVFADTGRLTQLFNNLLENVVRYTDAGGRLRVRCRRDGETVCIDVEDSAPGVPEHLLPQLFDRLFRVERSRSRSHGGAGLGLAICRNIVEAHGGRIEARPSPLGGLWIELQLPLSTPAGDAAVPHLERVHA